MNEHVRYIGELEEALTELRDAALPFMHSEIVQHTPETAEYFDRLRQAVLEATHMLEDVGAEGDL
jgi:hypothetical protein